MVGTLYNAAAVFVGASAGLALGKRIPASIQQAVFSALGLFTLGLGGLMATRMTDPFAIFLALVFGVVAGQGLRLHERMSGGDGATEGSPGWVQASILFCAGAMTVVGCMEDGLAEDPTVLLVKGTMDLVSGAFLAAALGRSVLWSALAVLVFQGAMTLGFQALGPVISEELIAELGALGGVMLLALGLDLLGVRSFRLLNMLPALLLLPLTRPVSAWIQEVLPGLLPFA